MPEWYVDEGLATFIAGWKKKFPKATVYTIGDSNHSTDPDKSQHAPDTGGSKPGDDKGEVDAIDVMPGKGVTDADLQDLFDGLLASRDKRILYVIYKNKIFSSVVSPWKVRTHTGAYHGHVHLSVNDNFDNDKSPWNWERLVDREWEYTKVGDTYLPALQFGDDDQSHTGWNHVGRAQALLNYFERKDPLDFDGVYGAYTRDKVKRVFGGNGMTLPIGDMRKLHGI